jgi:two-component system phosphate regulon sensor histidine kinase PhoR
LTNEIVESFKLKASQKNITLDVINNASQEDLYVNQQILVMCLHNLIDNAIKYIKSDQPRITINIHESTKDFVIAVVDNGIPIPEEQKSKIFEKFYRIPQGDVHDVKGHGLGLYIVSQLANSLKGNVTLTTDNDGNTFSLSIPKST